MMDKTELLKLKGFYENELKSCLLSFWLPRCEDTEYGGFVNCFDNKGENLVSTDKYCWSQGRFVWIFSHLAMTPAPIFTSHERAEFQRLAKNGADFLMSHCLIAPDDWRCVFLLDRAGNPKYVEGYNRLDMSIYADCFVIGGLASYAYLTDEREPYEFAKKLYESALLRVKNNNFQTLPYPLRPDLRAHGIPMIFANISKDIYYASTRLDPYYSSQALVNMENFESDILEHFLDNNGIIHEIITNKNTFFDKLLGQHCNPGHSIEDAWFALDTAELTGHPEWRAKIENYVLKTLESGWDKEYGGILHFASVNGGEPAGNNEGFEDEPMSKQLSGWADKLWWIHSEALYTTLRLWLETGDDRYKQWHDKVFQYVYSTFPNPDPEIREWIQIRRRDGIPEDKVVALPVKDPFHIIRDVTLIIEALARALENDGG